MSETEQTPKRVTYDAPADVLYVTFEDAPAVKGTETTEGTVRRYGEGGKLIGVTIVDFAYRLQAGDIAPASLSREAALRETLEKASGYMTNAAIDLQTGAPKRTALNTIEGGLKMVRDALAQGTPK